MEQEQLAAVDEGRAKEVIEDLLKFGREARGVECVAGEF
jgi:hypothetical protein